MPKNKSDNSIKDHDKMWGLASRAGSLALLQTMLVYLVLLTIFFVFLEVSFFIQCNKAYLSDFNYVSGQIKIPASVLPAILFFIGAQLAVHLGYCLLVVFAAFFGGYLLKLTSEQKFNFSIMLWLAGMGAAMALNQFYFPHSKFTELTSLLLVTNAMAKSTAILLSLVFVVAIALSVAGCLVWLTRLSFNFALLMLLVGPASAWMMLNQLDSPGFYAVKHTQPNVIIIGIDSLRPDYLGYFGADHATPTLDSMLDQSTVFVEAVTPIARTFPSWVSILTGLHPHQSGVRSNLVNVDKVNFDNSLASLFQQKGYATIYATDETRFSNIDHKLGFNQVIAPPAGLNDFLLGTFNDFPLSNLLINSRLGHWLFPYSYANRPASHTYDPSSFIELMRPEIMRAHSQPLFMAVHFCLPHYPYAWSSSANHDTPLLNYQASIHRVDQQIKQFMAMLQDAQLLNNAVVVLLSDHGEALELPGDRITDRDHFIGIADKAGQPPRFYPPSLDNETVNQSAGHGTDVLGLPQYHTLLAFKLFGMGSQRIGDVPGVVPLSDIKATLLVLAGITPESRSLPSLAAIIREQQASVRVQHVFIESDFSPASIRTVYPETRNVMLEGVHMYEIDPLTTRLSIKADMGKKIIRSKQYADIYGEWMLAFYPQNDHFHQPILINLQSGIWTDDLSSAFALSSPASVMKNELKKFYGIELADV